ncbi:ABC transporter ATP-binding protein [Rhodoplanes sp. TEM]|uniref:ABC transporter ATP-binding protein n=1 Tax=Rhodoplanes tepidamans TaxID=200616 RepID=A0ABT5JDC2_RHOTP|nr:MULTISPECIES: ABC transporter ATP-binding protein [Rhodoplanes]MDC7787619.1 ABC transporter ATP-binding protein [Rhodoplanes tepidamans]MDC7984565.1 ABC transporter ATP-binding protein [Rhodoplanes sp. TEM]MDQ0355188.1 putative spermidine/putrescine transport system ATP-binding protein [Rhodoplanes tepidamans]
MELTSVSHRFGPATVIDDVSLAIAPGEFIAFLGPSGCGKTTLLRIVAGFITPSSGEVRMSGAAVGGLGPAERGVGIVFQNYALFPHMTVARNVDYGLRARGWPRARRDARVREMLGFVRMSAFADRYPRQLSGGQQQRVALARALAVDPSILLLDEPFGALDKNLRLDMQIELERIHRDAGLTTIMVTHDQEEALALADRIAVFDAGRLEQFGTPQEIYDRPATRFVSSFVGHTNLLPGRLLNSRGEARIATDAGPVLVLPQARPCGRPGRVLVAIRPENLRLATSGEASAFAAVVRAVMPLGPTIAYDLALADGTPLKLLHMRGAAPGATPGAQVHLQIADPTHCPVYID